MKDEASIFYWKGTTTELNEKARKDKLNKMNQRSSRTCRPILNSRQIHFTQLQLRRKIEYFQREAADKKYRETMENNIKYVQGIIQSLDEAMEEN